MQQQTYLSKRPEIPYTRWGVIFVTLLMKLEESSTEYETSSNAVETVWLIMFVVSSSVKLFIASDMRLTTMSNNSTYVLETVIDVVVEHIMFEHFDINMTDFSFAFDSATNDVLQ